jgi:hypothetical protein
MSPLLRGLLPDWDAAFNDPLAGREKWALSHLMTTGCTSIMSNTRPCPRWSDCVLKPYSSGLVVMRLAEHCVSPLAGALILHCSGLGSSDLQVPA